MPRSDLFESELLLQELEGRPHVDLWVQRQDRVFEIPSTVSFLRSLIFLLFTPLEDEVKNTPEAKLIFTIISFALWDLTRLNSRKRSKDFESAIEFIFINEEPLESMSRAIGLSVDLVRQVARMIIRGELKFKQRTRVH